MKEKFYLVLIFFIALTSSIQGQRYTVLSYGLGDKEIMLFPLKSNQFYDSISILNKSQLFISTLRSRGYAFANIDTINFYKSQCKIYFFIGKKIKFNIIQPDVEIKNVLNISGVSFNYKYFPDSVVLEEKVNQALRYLNNHGHPFASIRFSNIEILDNNINATLSLSKGKYIVFDSLNIIGRYNLNKNYLHNYLEIHPFKYYENDKIFALSKRLNDLQFISSDSLPSVSFINDKAVVNLFLKNKAASRFDFIVGALPTVENGVRKFKINIDLLADLVNKFGQGESITVKFQRLKEDDVQGLIAFNYPYILGTPVGFDGSFELLQNNGRSSDAIGLLGMQYIFTGNNSLKLSWYNKTSRLSKIDAQSIINTSKLPSQLDFSYNGVALAFLYRKVDYRFNPTRGFEINTRFNTGTRTIIKNFQITEIKSDGVDFSKAYDSLSNRKFQAIFNIEANKYFPIKKVATIKFALNSGLRYTQGLVLENEAFRIGGNRLLRGFDELSIATDRYILFTSEFRIILEKNSFLSLPFIDIGRLRVLNDGFSSWKTAIGIGLGFNFSTKAGIFNFSFAAGNKLSGSPDFGNTKIHFGYLNLF